MRFRFPYLWQSFVSAVPYISVSLRLALIPLALGLMVGALIAIVRVYRVPVLAPVLRVAVTLYSGIPTMVALLIYNLVYLTCFGYTERGTFAVVLLTFTLEEIVYLSESIRGAFLSVPRGQYEAAYSAGLTEWQVLSRIVIPQVIPVALPQLTNNVVGAIKNTSIVLVVGIVDILNGALEPCMETYSFIEGYVAAALLYWLINGAVECILKRMERRLLVHRTGGA